MAISSGIWDLCNTAVLALTPAERLAAAQKGGPALAREDYSLLILGIVLGILVLLLGWVTWRHGARKTGVGHEPFWDHAAQRGLSARERQILLAVVARSRLRRGHDVFTKPDAFDRGASELLAECARDRTPHESERLRREVQDLRAKMEYAVKPAPVAAEPPVTSSRNIPVDASIELLGAQDRKRTVVSAVVVRNDDLEMAVESRAPLSGVAGQTWRVRYRRDESVYEFETSAISCENQRLVLNHGERARVAEHDHPDSIPVQAPAAVGRFPFVRATTTDSDDVPSETAQTQWFELVHAAVTEVSASSLQILSPLTVREGERILVMFALESGEAVDETELHTHVIGHIARVKNHQACDGETLMTVELLGLAETEAAELMRLANAAESYSSGAVGMRMKNGA